MKIYMYFYSLIKNKFVLIGSHLIYHVLLINQKKETRVNNHISDIYHVRIVSWKTVNKEKMRLPLFPI